MREPRKARANYMACTDTQRKAMAAAPQMARVLKRMLTNYDHDDYHGTHLHITYSTDKVNITAILHKAGVLKGD